MAMQKFRASPLPNAPQEYSPQHMAQLIRIVELYFSQLDSQTPLQADNFVGGGYGLQVPSGVLVSTADQPSAGVTAENLVLYSSLLTGEGVEVSSGSRIKVSQPGLYVVNATLEFANRASTPAEIEVWTKTTGVVNPLSNQRVDIASRKDITVWSHNVVNLQSIVLINNPQADYIEIAWWSDGADVFLEHYVAGASPTRPEIPSATVSVSFVSATY